MREHQKQLEGEDNWPFLFDANVKRVVWQNVFIVWSFNVFKWKRFRLRFEGISGADVQSEDDQGTDSEHDPPYWQQLVGREVLAGLMPQEIKRQEVINGENILRMVFAWVSMRWLFNLPCFLLRTALHRTSTCPNAESFGPPFLPETLQRRHPTSCWH